MNSTAEKIMDVGAPCLGFETWESDEAALNSPQTLGAPSIRHLSGERVGDHDPKPTLFPWCNE